MLGLFLFALIWEGVNSFLPIDSIGNFSIGYYFELPESKLFMPIFFLHYVLRKSRREQPFLKYLKIAYFIAFLVVFISFINLNTYIFFGENLRQIFGESKMEAIFMSQQVLAYLLSVLVFIISIVELRKVRIYALENYSDPDKAKFNWLWRFVFLFAPMILLWGVELLRIFLELPEGLSDLIVLNWFLVFIALYYISFRVFSEPDLFSEINVQFQTSNSSSPEGLSLNQFSEIEAKMKEEKYYQNSDLLLHELSKELNLSSRKISAAIKEYKHTNFSTWINTYRVNEAIDLIRSNTNLSIEGIGQDVGFKSRSAMYSAFKKIKGKTPGDFK